MPAGDVAGDATITSTMFAVKVDRSARRCCTTRSRRRSAARSADGEARPASACHRRAISPPCSASTPTPCCGRCGCCATRACLEFRRGHGIRVAGTPQRSAVIAKAHELLQLARHDGYLREELVQIIQGLP